MAVSDEAITRNNLVGQFKMGKLEFGVGGSITCLKDYLN